MSNSGDGHLSDQARDVVRGLAAERTVWSLAGGQVKLVRTYLPDHLVAGIAREKHGQLWVFVDSREPDSYAHLRQLLGQIPEGLDEELRIVGRELDAGAEPLPFDDEDDD